MSMLAGRTAEAVVASPTYSLGLRVAAARLLGEFNGSTWFPARHDD